MAPPALTRAVLAEYWNAGGDDAGGATTRRMLAGFDTAAGTLRPPVRALVAGRRFASRPAANPLTPYDEQEWQHLQQACRRIADTAFAGHRNAAAAAGRGHDPASAGWNEDNLRWLLVHRGRPAPRRSPPTLAYLPPA